jgi:hypothetical protein
MGRALVLSILLLGIGFVGYFFGARTQEEPQEPESVVEVAPTPNVVTALQKLARLEGAALHLERVIDLKEKQSRFFGLVEAEDAILLIAAGDVTAGVDLSAMAHEDIEIDETKKTVRVRLPRATLFSARVDNERTYVHSRATDTLAERQANLETEARREAERGFRKAAEEAGLMKTAEESVARTVRALILSLGFSSVEVTFADPGVPRASGPKESAAPQAH